MRCLFNKSQKSAKRHKRVVRITLSKFAKMSSSYGLLPLASKLLVDSNVIISLLAIGTNNM